MTKFKLINKHPDSFIFLSLYFVLRTFETLLLLLNMNFCWMLVYLSSCFLLLLNGNAAAYIPNIISAAFSHGGIFFSEPTPDVCLLKSF